MTIQVDPERFDPTRATTVRGLLEVYQYFTDPAIRGMFQRAQEHYNSKGELVPGNGLAGAIRRLGGRGGKVLVDPVLFGEWLRAQPCPEERPAARELANSLRSRPRKIAHLQDPIGGRPALSVSR